MPATGLAVSPSLGDGDLRCVCRQQDGDSDRCGHQRSDQDGQLGLALEVRASEGQAADEQYHREADAGQEGGADQVPPG